MAQRNCVCRPGTCHASVSIHRTGNACIYPPPKKMMLKPIWPPLTMAVFTAPVVVVHVSFGRAALLFQARSGLKVLAFKQEKLNLGTSKLKTFKNTKVGRTSRFTEASHVLQHHHGFGWAFWEGFS